MTRDPREPRWNRFYAVVAGLLALETLAFWLLEVWAR
jgi:hypothetical protein